jgi:hypothetical protein
LFPDVRFDLLENRGIPLGFYYLLPAPGPGKVIKIGINDAPLLLFRTERFAKLPIDAGPFLLSSLF